MNFKAGKYANYIIPEPAPAAPPKRGFSGVILPEKDTDSPLCSPAKPDFYEDTEDEFLCKICFEGASDCTILPCGHKDICHICVRFMRSCPFCRLQIIKFQH